MKKRLTMPNGLPASLAEGKDGFDRLCVVLDIANRAKKQVVAKLPVVKQTLKDAGLQTPRGLKTADRLRVELIAFYSDPALRRRIYRSEPLPAPSFEWQVIEKYLQDCNETDVDDDAREKSSSLVGVGTEYEDWQRSARDALPFIYTDTSHWNALPKDRQNTLKLAIFAVATVLDQAQLLNWAADQVEELDREFGFRKRETDVEQVAATSQRQDAVLSSDDSIVAGLQDACQTVADIALELRKKPADIALFDKLSRSYEQVIGFREPILTAFSTERLVNRVIEHINSFADDAPWSTAEAEKIRARWTEVYEGEGTVDLKAIQADVERLEEELPKAVSEWRRLCQQTKTLKQELEECESPELYLAVGESMREDEAAKKYVHIIALPTGHGTEPAHEDEIQPVEADTAAPTERDSVNNDFRPSDDALDSELAVNSDTSGEAQSTLVDAPETEPAIKKKRTQFISDDRGERDTSTISEPSPAPWGIPTLDRNETAFWCAVDEGRWGIAYYIARSIPKAKSVPPLNLVVAAALASSVNGPTGDIVQVLQESLATLDSSFSHSQMGDTFNLLLFSALLRPALFAPTTGALPKLNTQKMSSRLRMVQKFGKTLAQHAERLQQIHFDTVRLRDALGVSDWSERFDDLVSRIDDWHSAAQRQRILFHGAQAVWQYWLRDDGILGELVNLLSTSRQTDQQRVREILAQFEEQSEFDKLVHKTDRSAVGRAFGEAIHGRALEQLRHHAEPALALAREWFRLINGKPDPQGFVEGQIIKLRDATCQNAPAALAAIEQLEGQSIPLSAALTRTRQSIEEVVKLFDANRSGTSQAVESPAVVLGQDLLHVPALDLDAEFRPTNGQTRLDLLIDFDRHTATLENAFDARLERGDIIGSGLACDRMAVVGDPSEERCRDDFKQAIGAKREQIRKQMSTLTEEIEQAYWLGQLTADERNNHAGHLSDCQRRFYDVVDAYEVVHAEQQIAEITTQTAASRDVKLAAVRGQVGPLWKTMDPKDKVLVEKALEVGDLTTLNEQIERLKQHDPIQSENAPGRDIFADFLVAKDKVEAILCGANRPIPEEITTAARDRQTFAGVDFSGLSGRKVEQSSQFLEVWYDMSRSGRVDEEKVKKFFSLLGFIVNETKVTGSSVTLVAEPLRDRTICPLYLFGSAAEGRYRILLDWGAAPRDTLIQAISDLPVNHIIVLHFGPLGSDRNWIHDWARQRQRLFLVVDETLMLFLAALDGGRLQALFKCALPFTIAEPFVTTSSLVPPEMFYGRAREGKDILDRYGSCFVYGGRQIGKTALLRSTAAMFNRGSGQVAKWIDLKAREIGYAYQPEEIWRVLWRELREEVGIVQDHEPKMADLSRKLADGVKSWVRKSGERRLVLLLDEADAFLKADAESGFKQSTLLKSLMDETNRKFKIVFCGLHNVLRTVEQANHPLAHLGEPICIGPLLENGEWQQARSLIIDPLTAIGYPFEDQNLPTHILAETNYYPSLIQLFGAALVRYLRDTTSSVPFKISMKNIREAFRRDDFRRYIRERFSLTLQLDQRYEVIANIMALEFQGLHGNLAHGLDQKKIVKQVREWWPAGFKATDREIVGLLHEMEGLGVLREVNAVGRTKHFTFRNPNILLLLGTKEDIANVLLKDREQPTTFDPAVFHTSYRSGESPERSPLTYQQESILIKNGGVAIVAGAETAIHRMEEYVRSRDFHRALRPCGNVDEFERQLTSLRPDPRRGTHVYLVPRETPWSTQWIVRAALALQRVERRRNIRVVLIADPPTLWHVLEDMPTMDPQAVQSVDQIDAGPWDKIFLRRWCEDISLQVDPKHIDALMTVSGGWPQILEEYAQMEPEKWRTMIEHLESSIAKNRGDWLQKLGVDTSEIKRELEALCTWAPFTSEEGQTIVTMESAEESTSLRGSDRLRRRLEWAQRLGLFQQSTEGKWDANPLLKRLLIPESGG